jgi:hypothetical protein
MPNRAKSTPPTRALWLIPLAAILATLPLILHGCSPGHDLVFHVQGWLDAAQQLRHGHYPRWSFTSAWNAGEPRFLFYPPLSWLLGALLTLLFPAAATQTIYIFLVLLLSGLTFHHLASNVLPNRITPNAALIAAALYLANPYMLFNAFERSAMAELLAAAWIPLLLLAILRPRPTIRGIAIPIALLWLTNAPAAVMGCYALALLATLRLTLTLISPATIQSPPSAQDSGPGLLPQKSKWGVPWPSLPLPLSVLRRHPDPELVEGEGLPHFAPPHPAPPAPFSPIPYPLSPALLAVTCIAGTLLGLALPAFYLLPAAYERRYIQVAMAIIPGMRPQDNFLFAHTPDSGHNGVNLQISLLALTLILLTLAALIALLLRTFRPKNSVILSEVSRGSLRETQSKDPPPTQSPPSSLTSLALALTVLAATITFLLFPPSTFLWLHVPDLAFLQLPWRLLTLLTPILTLTLALILSPSKKPGAPPMTRPHRGMSGLATISALAATLLLPLILGFTAFHLYAQFCQPDDLPSTIAQHLSTHHGFPPTDEYTPNLADNDILRTNDPAFWLLPNLPNGQPANPNTPAPNTTPTATELDPTLDTDDTPIPLAQTLSAEAPKHLTLNLPQPETLVLNLRDYPNWDVTGCGENTMECKHYPEPPRDDGLLAMQLPRGERTIHITWHRTPDQTLGIDISVLAAFALALTFRHRRV